MFAVYCSGWGCGVPLILAGLAVSELFVGCKVGAGCQGGGAGEGGKCGSEMCCLSRSGQGPAASLELPPHRTPAGSRAVGWGGCPAGFWRGGKEPAAVCCL